MIAFTMKVFKNLFGRGDKIHVDEIAVKPGLLLGGAVIVDSGTGANGSWVKWGNGYMECQHHIASMNVSTSTATLQGVTLYRASAYWDYPISFIETPVVDFDAGITTASFSPTMTRRLGIDTEQARLQVVAFTNFNEIYNLSYSAAGWWKEPGT